jgi:hypothetical protein
VDAHTLTEKLLYEPGTGHFVNATYAEAAAFATYAESVVAAFSEAKNEIAILCERIGRYHATLGHLDQALMWTLKTVWLCLISGWDGPMNK